MLKLKVPVSAIEETSTFVAINNNQQLREQKHRKFLILRGVRSLTREFAEVIIDEVYQLTEKETQAWLHQNAPELVQADPEEIKPFQIRPPGRLKRQMESAAIARDITMNALVLSILSEWFANENNRLHKELAK